MKTTRRRVATLRQQQPLLPVHRRTQYEELRSRRSRTLKHQLLPLHQWFRILPQLLISIALSISRSFYADLSNSGILSWLLAQTMNSWNSLQAIHKKQLNPGLCPEISLNLEAN
ncbi:hypothetical protein [Solenopsis invicta virus 12]|nr:hypothetical protein [Solenopsis invicta virus 12]